MTQQIFELDNYIVEKLKHFSIPVKTKNLANRLNLDPVKLSESLKRLESKGLIYFGSMRSTKGSKKVGWVIAYSNL